MASGATQKSSYLDITLMVNNIFIIYSDHEYRMLPLVDGYLVLFSTVFISGEEGRGRLTVVRNKLFYTV